MSNVNPYQSPTFSPPLPNRAIEAEPTFLNVLTSTADVLLSQWSTLLTVLIFICLPWEILNSYIDFYVATEDDQTLTVAMLLLSPLTAILLAESILIAATRSRLLGLRGGVADSFARGIMAYPRLLLWMIASGIVIGVGTVLCVLPGIYLNIRWMYVSAAVVMGEYGGRSPLNTSWDLTQRHLTFSILLFLGLCLPMVVMIVAPALLMEVIPSLQHWLVYAALSLFDDVILLAVTCAFACAYHHLQVNEERIATQDVVVGD